MAQWSSHDIPVDPMLFSPFQMRPRAVLGAAVSGIGRWFAQYAVPYRQILTAYRTATVIGDVRLDYGVPDLRFHDADWLTVHGTLATDHTGRWLRWRGTIAGGERVAASIVIDMRVVTLSDGGDFGAVPGTMPPQLLARFDSDDRFTVDRERTATPPTSVPLTEPASNQVTLYRSQCEVADQWSFIEAIELLTQSRDRLLVESTQPTPRLRQALSAPVRTMSVHFHRAMFSFDQATVTTQAFDASDGLLLVHSLGREGRAEPNLTAWELMADVSAAGPEVSVAGSLITAAGPGAGESVIG